MPDTDEIFAHAEVLTKIKGTRQSGSKGGVEAQKYILEKFNEYGLDDVHVIPTETPLWQCENWNLEIEGEEIDSYKMYMSFFDGKYDKGGVLKADSNGVVSKGNATYGTFSTADEGNTEDADIIYVKDAEAIKKMKKSKIEGKVVVANTSAVGYCTPDAY